MGKAGIEPAIPVLQDIGLSPTPRLLQQTKKTFCGFPGYIRVPPGWFGFMFAHQKWFYREAGNQTCDPLFTRQSFILYTKAALAKKKTCCSFPGYKPVLMGLRFVLVLQ